MYVEELSNISTCNVIGNMLPKNENFVIHEQHVSGTDCWKDFNIHWGNILPQMLPTVYGGGGGGGFKSALLGLYLLNIA